MAVHGVGLQINATTLAMVDDVDPGLYNFSEVLCDSVAAPLDCGYVIDPAARPVMEQLAARHPLLAHGNHGNEFGYDPLDETPGVRRHIAIAHEMKSPWYADHMFFGFRESAFMWSSPLQFSRLEIERVAGRAAALQDRMKLPLLHENAFYYARFPGSEIEEAEFIAGLVERAQTYLLLDLHNCYSNSVNFPDYDHWKFLKTIPLDRVIEIHLAGGEQIEDWYHDFHNHYVPEPVWEMLEYVLKHASRLEAVTLEVQGPAHSAKSHAVMPDWPFMVSNDLKRARQLWDSIRGPGGRA
ncbi:MAG: DUF692 domain-containing protein [Deltaproteobacteria bacterium]|nr:MAG: DUF692 domain-containing protein [Deltaproteobacteria bacterium]TMQ18980.1 MAG: DUF692 domain-containing protein [Deltaproteobacteria bacterium]